MPPRLADAQKDVDARDKRGHDEQNRSGSPLAYVARRIEAEHERPPMR